MARALLVAVLFAASVPLVAQAPVPVFQEPRHRLLFANESLRVLDVNVFPADMTLDHEHAHDLAQVRISVAQTRAQDEGEAWGPARPVGEPGDALTSEYAGRPRVHRVENLDTRVYRLIAVENLVEDGWSSPTPITADATTKAAESRAFSMYRVRLAAAEHRTRHTHERPTVVVLVSGSVVADGGARGMRRLVRAGQFVVLAPGVSHSLTAAGGSAHVVEVEVK